MKDVRVKRQLMAEQWNQFSRSVLPLATSPLQRREMRRAFYAGAQAILFRVIAALGTESEPTAEDLRIMQDVSDELEEFARQVKAGLA